MLEERLAIAQQVQPKKTNFVLIIILIIAALAAGLAIGYWLHKKSI